VIFHRIKHESNLWFLAGCNCMSFLMSRQ
jgi:hypothetical protein